MAIPPDQFQIMLQHQQQNQHQHQQVAQSFRNMYSTDGRVVVVAGLAPVPLAGAADDNNGGCNLQFGYGVEPKKRKLEVQDFFENNSQISSQDILRPVPVSTGLGLSLDNGQVCSSGDSGFLSLIGEDLGKELQQQEEEIDRFLKVQAERMRQAVMQKMREQQMKTVSFLENKVLNKLHEKDSELRMINQKNMVLEDRLEKETMKLDLWKQRAKYNTTMMSALRQRLQEISEQNGLNKEGFGDSEIVDTASCCNGRGPDLYYLPKDHSVMQELTTCKGCGQKEVCMLLLPCKHLCLCKECESKLSLCPLCHSSKFFGMEVYI